MASRVASKIRETFGQESLDWIDRSYIVDWAVASMIWGLSGVVNNFHVFERDFSLDDPLISHPYTHEQVSGQLNNITALYVPFVLIGAIGGIRRSVHEIHHGILSVWASRGLARLVTVFLKVKVGRLRPDFLSRCNWDTTIQACTGRTSDILNGRKSFPSGHSSGAFAGMTFLSLWIAGQTAAWCFRAPSAPASFRASRMGALALTFLPLAWALYVAVSRIEDYRHHKEDVIVGSMIGVFSAIICYLIFWPNPCSIHSFAPDRAGRARLLYTDGNDWQSRNDDFQLTRLEDEIENV